MHKTLLEIAEFTGKASGIIVRDVSEFSGPLAEAFRRGWNQAMSEERKSKPETEAPDAAQPAQ